MKEKKDFKVALLRTPIIFTTGSLSMSSITPPLALAYLSASLREAGFSVTAIDSVGEGIDHVDTVTTGSNLSYQGLSISQIIDRIGKDVDLLGISCMFSSEWTHSKRIIKAIKKANPHLTIIVGGEHATALPELVLNDCPEVDAIALGEGDETIVDIAEHYRTASNFEQVPGLAIRKQGQVIRTAPRTRIKKVDDLPWPAWDLVPLQAYFDAKTSHGPYRGRTMPILASRGCPYECTFCSNPLMYGRLYITRNPEDVVDEIASYIERYQIKCVDFYDLTTITKRKWILEFCDLILQRGVKFSWQISGGTRTEAIDEEVIIKAKQAGCEYLGFAPESGSEEVINVIKKRVDLKRMTQLFQIGIKHGIGTRANFIIGFPRETRSQIYETLFMQIKLATMGVLDAPVFEFTPYPGSEDFSYLRDKGVISKLDDAYFDSLASNLSFKEMRKYCENVSPFELKVYQLLGMLSFYFIYYLTHPGKLLSFIKGFWREPLSNSVFEQRIFSNLKKYGIGLSK